MRVQSDIYTHYLSIDYGKKRVGLALSDPTKIFSYPFKTITNDKNIFLILQSIIKEKNIEKIILGNPLSDSGAASKIFDEILAFKKKLEIFFKGEIILWDESYSSEIAKELIVLSVPKKSKRRQKGIIDKNAAAIFLQEYIDNQKK